MQALIAPFALCAAALWSATYKKPTSGGGPADLFYDDESESDVSSEEPNEAYAALDEIVVGHFPDVYANSKDFWGDVTDEDVADGHSSAPIQGIIDQIGGAVEDLMAAAGPEFECDGQEDAEYHQIAWLVLSQLPDDTYNSEADFHQAAYRMLLSHFEEDSDESVSTRNLWEMAKWCRNNGFLNAKPYAHIKNLVRQAQDPENPVIDDSHTEDLQEGWETDSNTEVAYDVQGIDAFMPWAGHGMESSD